MAAIRLLRHRATGIAAAVITVAIWTGFIVIGRASAGRTLLQAARQMLQLHDQALAQLQSSAEAAGPVTGVLRIGAMETTAALRLPPLLALLRQQHPQVDLEDRKSVV